LKVSNVPTSIVNISSKKTYGLGLSAHSIKLAERSKREEAKSAHRKKQIINKKQEININDNRSYSLNNVSSQRVSMHKQVDEGGIDDGVLANINVFDTNDQAEPPLI